MTGTIASLVELVDPVPDADGTPIARFMLPRARNFAYRQLVVKATGPCVLQVDGAENDDRELPEGPVKLVMFGLPPHATAIFYCDGSAWRFLSGVGG